MNRRDVVITGIGVVSPIGIGREAFWESLVKGRSGICVRERFADTDWPIRIAAPVKDFVGKQFIKPRKAIKIMCAPIQYGCAAAAMAVEEAGISQSVVAAERMGTVIGTETFYADPNEVADVFRKCTVNEDYQHDKWGEFAMREIQPLWMLKYLPNMVASHISIANDARGPSNSICQGEVSGMLALIEAADLIQRGAANVVVAGGTGSMMNLTAMLYRGTDDLSRRINEPQQACRPFDVMRDGIVVGAGAGAFVLELAEHAEARGAKVLARISGWARSFMNTASERFADAVAANYRAALDSAQVESGDIGLVNSNASGAVAMDQVEADAIRSVFADAPVVAHKSSFGNLGPGTSAVEFIASVLAIENGIIPASLNCDNVDPKCGINIVTENQNLNSEQFVLKSSFSNTGQIASVVIK